MEDRQIVDLYWARSEDAIFQTQKKYGAYLHKISGNILSNPQDREECVNDTYLAAWNSMPVQRPGVLSTYLGRIVRQLSIDVFRKKSSIKRRTSAYAVSLAELEDTFPGGTDPEQELDAKLLENAIARFLRTLPADARNAFVGRYYFFDSMKEVAAYCGMGQGKLKSLLYRTRQALREALREEGFDV